MKKLKKNLDKEDNKCKYRKIKLKILNLKNQFKIWKRKIQKKGALKLGIFQIL